MQQSRPLPATGSNRSARTAPAFRSGRRPVFAAVLGALAAGLMSGCGDSSDAVADGPAVVATTSILADVTSNVLCGQQQVPALIPAGTDAHDFEPSVREAQDLESAEVVVTVGLGLEEGLEDALEEAAGRGVQVIEVGPEVDTVEAPEGSGPDPHFWMDPDRMAVAAEEIGASLKQADLGIGAEEIDRCTDAYTAELRELSAEMDARFDTIPPERRRLVSAHQSLGYLADRFGFTVIGSAVPSTSSLGETAPRQLEELAAEMRAQGVTAIFTDIAEPSPAAEDLAGLVGEPAEVVGLHIESLAQDGPAGTYAGMMRSNSEQIVMALGGTAQADRAGPDGG